MNHKGGVAKTTSLLNLVAGIARMYKKRVCIIDADPQANTTMAAFGEEMASLPREVLLESALQDCMQDAPPELKPPGSGGYGSDHVHHTRKGIPFQGNSKGAGREV